MIFIDNMTNDDSLKRLYDSENVYYVGDIVLHYFNFIQKPKPQLAMTKDRLNTFYLAIHFRKNSILTEIFNRKIEKMTESGLVNYWASKYKENHKTKLEASTKYHYANIIGVFQFCAVLIVIDIVVFILELMSPRYNRVKYVMDYFTY